MRSLVSEIRYLILFAVSVLGSSLLCELQAQSWRINFERLSVEHGLPHASVYCILKDRQGFMWFGTAKGLARYDGYSFKVFEADPHDPNGLSGNLVYALCEDKAGQIWIGTVGGGLNKFDPLHETFTHYKHSPENPRSLSSDEVFAVLEDRAGRIWIGTRSGLDLFDRANQSFTHADSQADDAAVPVTDQVVAIYECPSRPGILWIGTWGGGLKRFDCEKRTFAHFRHDPMNRHSLSNNIVWFIYEAPAYPGILWICTSGGGLNKFDTASERFTCYRSNPKNPATLSHDAVRSVVQDQSGALWVATNGGGVNRFYPETGLFMHYRKDLQDNSSLSDDTVWAMFEDEAGVHWVGTHEGLCRFGPERGKFVLYQHDPKNPNSLSDNNLNALCEDKSGILWVATGRGLNRFDPVTETFKCFAHDPHDPRSLRNNRVRAIYEDRVGTLWVGNVEGALHRFNRGSGRSRYYKILKDPRNGKTSDILSMLEDRSGTFWIGTVEGLNVFDRVKERYTTFTEGPFDREPANLMYVFALHEDTEGALWIGTRFDGLIRYQMDNRRFTVYTHRPDEPSSLSDNTVLAMYEDTTHTLWIGTGEGGLNSLNKHRGTFTVFDKRDGLPDNRVYGILPDNSGHLWLSTDKGLCRFDPRTKQCMNFDARHGLQGGDFNSASFCRSKTGTMYFGGVNGLNAFSPDSIRENTRIPPVFITSLKTFDKDMRTDTGLSYLTGVAIPFSENFVSFEFAALDFTDPLQNKYAYMLQGFDDTWIACGTRRYAAYTNLDPGDYIFRVKASNSHGFWNEAGASMRITVIPPYWKTWWFRLIAILLLGFILYGIYRYRLSHVLAQERLRLRIADDLHDDIGSELSSIALESDLIARRLPTGKPEQERLLAVGRTIRHAADNLRDVVWIVNPDQDKLQDLVTRMRDVAAALLRGIHFSFRSEGSLATVPLEMEFKRNVLMIFKEALNNIVKHAQATRVEIDVELNARQLRICLKDNGVGFDVAAQHGGRGLKSLQSRASAIGGKVEVRSSPGSGTTVCLQTNIIRL